jgi:hypothetical protein
MSDPITYNSAPNGGQATGAPAAPPAPAPAPARKKSVLSIIRLVLVVGVLVVGGGSFAYNYFSGNITAKTPQVGECVTASKSDADVEKVKAVPCTDAAAADKVVGVLDNQSSKAFKAAENPCTSFSDAESAIFYGKEKDGFVLCLAPNKK